MSTSMPQPHPTPNVPHYRPWKVAVPLPSDADLSPETKELLSQGAPLHVLRMFAGAQDIYPGIFTLIKEIFTAQGADPKLREIIILRTAYLTNCAYCVVPQYLTTSSWQDVAANGHIVSG